MPDGPVVLLVENDPELVERHAEWLADEYAVRTAIDGETALERFDTDVDVVLLDRQLPDMSGGGLLGRLRARDGDPAVGMLLGLDPDRRVLGLDVDEFVVRPIDRETLVGLVERLDRRGAVDEAVDAYLSLLDRRREFEVEGGPDALESNSDYRAVTGELVARRRQLESLLDRLEEAAGKEATDGETDETAPTASPSPSGGESDTSTSGWAVSDGPAADEIGAAAVEPIYRRRPVEFYGLWLVAALTYGVGDVVSTLYAVFGVPGVDEANPVVDALLVNFGVPGFLFLKLLVFLVLISVSVQGARTGDRFSYYWPPLLASALGIALTAWNVSLVVGVGTAITVTPGIGMRSVAATATCGPSAGRCRPSTCRGRCRGTGAARSRRRPRTRR
ncbi:MAG: response regulator [Halorubrum sp.]